MFVHTARLKIPSMGLPSRSSRATTQRCLGRNITCGGR